MRDEHSYGIIPCRWVTDHWEFFLVRLHAGHWGFPKGHAEKEETPLQTAERELLEETGLRVLKQLDQKTFTECYRFTHQGELINKSVTYYLAEVEGEVVTQEIEIYQSGWVLPAELENKVSFSEGKRIAREVLSILNHIKKT